MDKDKREDKKRDAPNVAETKKERLERIYSRLRALLQAHGYPVKGDREKKLQSTGALPQKKEDQVNAETFKEIPNWIPSFHSYEDFNRMTLQSLGGSIMILSVDGVIISVAENISSLLGYLPDEIVGKKLLSFLPDQEKREVFRKICLKVPVSSSGKHMEFCCHLKRGNLQSGGNLTYEYAKFNLNLKNIYDEPLALLSRFFPCAKYIGSSTTQLPLEDQFYIVGVVCILRAQTLRELLTVKQTSENIQIKELSDEDNSSALIVEDKRTSSRMEPLPAESAAVALKPLKIPPLVASYINRCEMELTKKFRKQLEETTQMLQADIRNQKNTLEMIKEQLNTLQGFKFQMQPTTLYHVDSYDPQFLEPPPKKQCTKQMERSFTDPSETKCFHVSCPSHSLKFSELFKEPCNASTQIQSIDVPLQLAAEQQDKNLGGQEDKSQSSFPEDHQEKNLLPLECSSDSEVISSASSSQSPATSDSDVTTLETTEDYIQLWRQPSDQQNHVSLQVKMWPCSEEDQSTESEPRVTCYYSCHRVQVGQQALAPEAEAQGPSGSQASQDPAENPPNQISHDLPAGQSNSDE